MAKRPRSAVSIVQVDECMHEADVHHAGGGIVQMVDGIQTATPSSQQDGGHHVDDGDAGERSAVVVVELLDAGHNVSVDDADTLLMSELGAVRGDAVDVAKVAATGLV